MKLLLDMPLVAKLPKNDPLNLLPPSRGTTFTLTPPLAASAEIAPVSKEISWAAASLSENVDHAPPPEAPIVPIGIPSTWIVMSNASPPWADKMFPRSPCVPPTSRWLAVTPGNVVPSVANDRAVGSASSASLGSVFCWEMVCTSTTGASPVTVIVSETAPTLRDTLTGAVKPAEISMPSRRTVLKPVSVKVTVYTPGRSCSTLYWPALSLTAVRVFSISAGLAASTVTPGRTAPRAVLHDAGNRAELGKAQRRKDDHR